ncbi:hypothetical protein [Streptomyces sp. PA03-2a]|uniref:hypothetical protein n=1 Tax=Streptomyces sp. PA03-2a TaxID=3028701 RepID=UPI0029B3C072|nr:hypothetical protein [Streptomyces sp. PA03-2a]MDX2732836.1 hypothetical protein [Streptomyces sp. PA03-2a]
MTTAARTAAFQPPPHGTPARYQGPRRHNLWDPCRCPDCRTAMRRADKLRELRRHRGSSGFQNRDAVASHLRNLLDHGWTGQQVATAAHINRKTVWNILNSELTTVRYDTAQAILGLVPTERPDGMVPAIGAMRRAHALAAMGWPLAWTADQTGLSYTGLRDISAGRTKSVQRTHHDAISKLFRTHAMRLGPSQVARRIALQKGWATAVAWDDIDDPAAQPETGKRREGGPGRREQVDPLEVARLTAAGRTAEQIARELRCHKRTVVRARGRVQPDMATAA